MLVPLPSFSASTGTRFGSSPQNARFRFTRTPLAASFTFVATSSMSGVDRVVLAITG